MVFTIWVFSSLLAFYSILVATEQLMFIASVMGTSHDTSSDSYRKMVLYLRLTYARGFAVIVVFLGVLLILQFLKLQGTLRKAYESNFYNGYYCAVLGKTCFCVVLLKPKFDHNCRLNSYALSGLGSHCEQQASIALWLVG
jgi:hypothetical protein